MKKLVFFLSQFIVACAVLSWEHIFSLPILFFALTILFFEWQPPVYRQILLIFLSVAFASLYQLPFTLSIFLFLGLIGGYLALGRVMRTTGLKVVVASIVGSLVIALLTHFQFSAAAGVIALISTALMVVVTHFMQLETRSEVRLQETRWETSND